MSLTSGCYKKKPSYRSLAKVDLQMRLMLFFTYKNGDVYVSPNPLNFQVAFSEMKSIGWSLICTHQQASFLSLRHCLVTGGDVEGGVNLNL